MDLQTVIFMASNIIVNRLGSGFKIVEEETEPQCVKLHLYARKVWLGSTSVTQLLDGSFSINNITSGCFSSSHKNDSLHEAIKAPLKNLEDLMNQIARNDVKQVDQNESK